MPKKRIRSRKEAGKSPNILDSAKLQELLGRPALLRGESAKKYNEIQARLMECLAPRDFVEQMLIAEYMCWSWEARRYSRHKVLSIEAEAGKIAKFQAKRSSEQVKAGEARRTHLNDSHPDTELGRIGELEDHVFDAIKEVEDILDGSRADVINARALSSTIVTQLQIDKLLNDAVVRQYEVFAQLERYRRGLGKRTERACGDVIDAEFSDARADGRLVPLVPAIEKRR